MYQNYWNGSARLNKMAATVKNRKKKIFKQDLLLGQWPNFKIISQKGSSYQCGESLWPKWLGRRLLLFLALHKVGSFRNLYSYQMEFVQIKRRVHRKSSSFWWCKRYSAIWSNSWEHSENVFAVSLGHWDNVQKILGKSFLTPIWQSLKGFLCWEHVKRHFLKKCL